MLGQRERTIYAADLFCGAGGASSALVGAVQELGLKLDLVAVNHWAVAIDTHQINHPGVRHILSSIETVKPRDAVPGGYLDLLLAGPSCTHHSAARGGKPVAEQPRSHANEVVKWCRELYVDTVLVENVSEFQSWGPIDEEGHPIPALKGTLYAGFIADLRALGYAVEFQVLNAADYGDATTRRRLFIIARRSGHPVVWPLPSHARRDAQRLPWRPAREIIDWTIPSKSIFHRKKPLSPNTMERIFTGLEKFNGDWVTPFIVVMRNNMSAQSIDATLPTITAGGTHIGLAQPLLMHVTHGGRVHSVDDPVKTVTGAHRGELALVQPSFMLSQQSGGVPRDLEQPVQTIATRGAISMVTPFLVPQFGERPGQAPRTHSLDAPMTTITASKGGPVLYTPFLAKYYGTAKVSSLDEPCPTLTAKDRLALVIPCVNGWYLDILFRMLQPRELARAMGFAETYMFTGTKGDQVKQIGNAWPVNLGRALIRELLRTQYGLAMAA